MATFTDILLPSLYNLTIKRDELLKAETEAFKKFRESCKEFHTSFCRYLIYKLGAARISSQKNLPAYVKESDIGSGIWTTSIFTEENTLQIVLQFGEEGSVAFAVQENSGTKHTPIWDRNIFSCRPYKKESSIILEITSMKEAIEHYYRTKG